ncbi:hypothetical protein O203_21315 [Ectopseudomonas chengduensis]|nr:hypothetical protein [Pseudomonas chengduensis]ERH47712.1 hypothetical protein O203_21315 [Pseudomonas chengduensis]
MIEVDDCDLRYLQSSEFIPLPSAAVESWARPANVFERRMAVHLRPGLRLQLELETAVRVLGCAAFSSGKAVMVDVHFGQAGLPIIKVLGHCLGAPPICADELCYMASALRWYRLNDAVRVRACVQDPGLFWLPLMS